MAAGLALSWATSPGFAEMRVIKVVSNDRALSKAFGEARQTLATALAATEKKHGYFSPSLALWVAIPVPDPEVKVEMVWVDNIRRDGTGFRGKLASHPRHMPGKRMRAPVSFAHSQIADWAVQAEDGRYYGYFSTRVMLTHLDPETAAEVQSILVPRTIPRLWEQLPSEPAPVEEGPVE